MKPHALLMTKPSKNGERCCKVCLNDPKKKKKMEREMITANWVPDTPASKESRSDTFTGLCTSMNI